MHMNQSVAINLMKVSIFHLVKPEIIIICAYRDR